MIRLFLDDMRRCPAGFSLARTAEECLLMLAECEVSVLSLDYDLGPGEPTGLDVVNAMVSKQLFPPHIYIHTSSDEGRRHMFNTLYAHKPAAVNVYNYAVPEHKLKEWEKEG